MKMNHSTRLLARRAIMASACLILCSGARAADTPKEGTAKKPAIKLLKVPSVPPGDQMGEAQGVVTGLTSCKGYRVVIYSLGGDNYWVQPTVENPYIAIGDKGKFTAEVHGGTEYVALLVKDSYKPAPKIEQPPNVGGEILACDRMKPVKSPD